MLIPVILSGGTGTRLWPVSREGHPKPFMRLEDDQSLLQKTFIRAANLPNVVEVMTVSNRDYYFKTKDDYAEIDSSVPDVARSFLLEPCGRNTAPAIALAALRIATTHGKDAVMLVLPADHMIQQATAFAAAVSQATALANMGRLVTFGISPTAPETGFGYIEAGAALDDKGACLVTRFVEKPDAATAEAYLATGRYLWNAGIFCFTAGAFLAALKQSAPDIFEQATVCWQATMAHAKAPTEQIELDKHSFASLADISIDYAVMEKADGVAVVPGNFGWSDIGSWSAFSDLIKPDNEGNRFVGEVSQFNVRNTYIHGHDRLVAAVGVENLIIVDTADAILVAHRDHSQDVRQVVKDLKIRDHDTYKIHRTVSRPWGTYTVLEEGDGFKIKRIVVKPGETLSLQMHYHRSEHWIVVAGMAKIVNGEQDLLINTNESTFIPAGHKHRLENPGKMDLVLIEVQSGSYLGEDDIVRFEDVYGRA